MSASCCGLSVQSSSATAVVFGASMILQSVDAPALLAVHVGDDLLCVFYHVSEGCPLALVSLGRVADGLQQFLHGVLRLRPAHQSVI